MSQYCPDSAPLGMIEQLLARIDDLEDQLARAERLATLGTMSGAIAHEFNNILTPLLSYSGMALENLDDHALVRRALERTVRGATRAGEIAEALLGSIQDPAIEAPTCLVSETITSAIESMVRAPERDGIEIMCDVPAELEAAIAPSALHQIMLNLILNACDALRPGPGTIAITGTGTNKYLPKCDQHILLRVIDTGPGIAPEQIRTIFEPLVTTKVCSSGQQRGDQRGGSGLGLTICKRLVERAGGEIAVRSEPGLGTAFSILLPAPARIATGFTPVAVAA
jgi:signal transduction histidine kinase